jgi:hypothetical protein
MSAEDITQLSTMLRSANTTLVFAGTLKDIIENGYYNSSLYFEGIPNNSKYICHKFEDTPPKDVTRISRNVREFFLRLIDPEPPLWLSDLCAALITVSALFLIHFICVPQQSALENGGHYNQLAQAFHSNVTNLLTFLGDHFKVGKFNLTVPDFCLCVTRQNLEVKILRRKT